jgi:hypothetical protein
MTESISAEAVADPSEWEPMDLGGQPGWIWQPEDGGEVHIRINRQGTHIWLRGLYDRDEALDSARSLAPVPRNPDWGT